jgi:hypothetical protein
MLEEQQSLHNWEGQHIIVSSKTKPLGNTFQKRYSRCGGFGEPYHRRT